jgi:hypothetical protein
MFERLLEAGSSEMPACRCGHDMLVASVRPKSDDASVKVFKCPSCSNELQLMVWTSALAQSPTTHALERA